MGRHCPAHSAFQEAYRGWTGRAGREAVCLSALRYFLLRMLLSLVPFLLKTEEHSSFILWWQYWQFTVLPWPAPSQAAVSFCPTLSTPSSLPRYGLTPHPSQLGIPEFSPTCSRAGVQGRSPWITKGKNLSQWFQIPTSHLEPCVGNQLLH